MLERDSFALFDIYHIYADDIIKIYIKNKILRFKNDFYLYNMNTITLFVLLKTNLNFFIRMASITT